MQWWIGLTAAVAALACACGGSGDTEGSGGDGRSGMAGSGATGQGGAGSGGSGGIGAKQNVVFVTSEAFSRHSRGRRRRRCEMPSGCGIGRPDRHLARMDLIRDSKCADRPGQARGWVRPDGLPFADELTEHGVGAVEGLATRPGEVVA
jgi:hypothetical protein